MLSKLYKSPTKAVQTLVSRALSDAKAKAGTGHGDEHKHNPELWRKLFYFVCIPAIAISAINTYLSEKEHHEHHARPEFVPYEYMYIRKRPFPWGDGNHSLFHNPRVNALPTGYEDLPEDGHGKAKH